MWFSDSWLVCLVHSRSTESNTQFLFSPLLYICRRSVLVSTCRCVHLCDLQVGGIVWLNFFSLFHLLLVFVFSNIFCVYVASSV